MKTRDITLMGILIALQVVTLFIVYVIPTIKFALLFASSLYIGIMLRIGIKRITVLISYIASCLLIVFLIQITDITAFFIAFFGWYGILHEATGNLGKVKKQIYRWLGFLLSGALLYLAFTYLISIPIERSIFLYGIVAAVLFMAMQIFYELCITELVKITGIKIIDDKIIFKK
jgi:hypothetical protein